MSNNYEMIPVVERTKPLVVFLSAAGIGAFLGLIALFAIITMGDQFLWPERAYDPTYWTYDYKVKLVLFFTLLGAVIGIIRTYRKSKNPFMYKGKVITRGKWTPTNLHSGYYVYGAICRAFTRTDARFSGSIQQFVDIRERKEQFIRRGFSMLVDLGLITTEGDTFTPTDLFLKYLPSS